MAKIIELADKQLPDNCVVFKNSTACPISRAAAEEVRSMEIDAPIYWINVIEQRDLSNWVASEYEVKHESPQLLWLVDGKPARVWNHRQITAEAVKRGIEQQAV